MCGRAWRGSSEWFIAVFKWLLKQITEFALVLCLLSSVIGLKKCVLANQSKDVVFSTSQVQNHSIGSCFPTLATGYIFP